MMSLGKLAPKRDERLLKFARYMDPWTPPPPARVNYGARAAPWPMLANDRVGCCTIATAAHLLQTWTANARPPGVRLSPETVLREYGAVTGYSPSDPSTDRGAVVEDVLRHWRKKGVGGRTILAYVGLDERNTTHVKRAVHLFGGCYVGLQLPLTAQDQAVWTVKGTAGRAAPGSWGGHAVAVVGYNRTHLRAVTWGEEKLISWSFWSRYCDESYAVLSRDFLDPSGLSPTGFALGQLRRDLNAVAG